MSKRYKAVRRQRYYRLSEPEKEIIRCWCGETGTLEELFCLDSLERTCGGSGELQCRCGGDLCVCHNHGQVECLGCEDCETNDEDYDDQESLF